MVDKLYTKKTEIRPSRQEIEGRRILYRMHEHDINSGGLLVEITGMPGSGKTSVMCSLANYTLKHHSNELVFWGSSYGSPLQFYMIGNNKWNILVQKNVKMTFFDRMKGEPIELDVTYFDDFEDLYNKSSPGLLNCPFFGDRLVWMDFIEWLMSKHGWHHLYIDEFSEVCPAMQSGDTFKKIGDFTNHTLGQMRRCLMNIVYNTQSFVDIDYRPRRKLMLKIFLPGAKTDGVSRVQQKAIDNLIRDSVKGNYAYLDAMGVFGVARFSDIHVPPKDVSIEARLIKEGKDNGTTQETREINTRGHISVPEDANRFREWKNRRETLLS